MNAMISIFEARGARQEAGEEIVGLLTGAAFTFALFFGMAHFENFGTAAPAAEIEDLRMVSMPFEPPPPPPVIDEPQRAPEEVVPFAGLEIGATDSPVSIAVVPPDLEMMFPTTTMPGAKIEFGLLHTELKPRAEFEFEANHIYHDTDVDQRPRALVRTSPPIPPDVSATAPRLRVVLILLIGTAGRVESARVMETSGNAKFDALVASTVQREWLFSPGIRRGKKVRVLAQQGFRVTFSTGGSPFDLK